MLPPSALCSIDSFCLSCQGPLAAEQCLQTYSGVGAECADAGGMSHKECCKCPLSAESSLPRNEECYDPIRD